MSVEKELDVQQQIAEALHDSAVLQAKSSEIFSVYPANSNRLDLEFLKVSTRMPRYSSVRGRSSAIDVSELDFFALLVEPRYEPMPDILRKEKAVNDIGSLLLGKNHVAAGSTHGDLFDVPADAVNHSGRLREKGIPHQSAMIVSKGIDYLGVQVEALGGPEDDLVKWMVSKGAKILEDNTIPARDAMKLIVDRLYLTIPFTRSFLDLRDSEKTTAVIRRFNRASRVAIAAAMRFPGAEPMLLSLAITGTKIKELDAQVYQTGIEKGITYRTVPDNIDASSTVRVIGRISSATIEVLRGVYLFPTATNLDRESPSITVGDMLYMDGEHDGLDIGGALVQLEQQINPSLQTVYDVDGKLPVK